MDQLKKKYGLILKKKVEETIESKLTTKPSIFNDDDDENEKETPTSSNPTSASVIRIQKAAEREHQLAQAEDPTIFDYDGSYDEIQAIKNEKKEEARKADRNRESKYAQAIIEAHTRRQLEQFSREERQQAKERQKEGDEFKDKEVFVTGAYRKQQEEVKKHREEEAIKNQFNESTSVTNQKMWEIGIGRTLLNDISRDSTAIKQRREKAKNARNRLESSPSPTRGEDNEEKATKKKSIYDEDEGENETIKEEKTKKNFEGELKPGLNKVVRKAMTKAERIQRNFTPTPPSSDGEEAEEGRRKHHRQERKSLEKEGEKVKKEEEEERNEEFDEKVDVKPDIRKLSLKEKLKTRKVDKVARLEGLKAILKQRNGPEEIEAMRLRYLERREAGIVIPPL